MSNPRRAVIHFNPHKQSYIYVRVTLGTSEVFQYTIIYREDKLFYVSMVGSSYDSIHRILK